jgi:hypothetical protein
VKPAKIALCPGLRLSAVDLATSVTSVLGIRGAGKSNLSAVVVEGLLDADIPVIVLDRVGIWFSLRLRPDGRKPSRFAIPVLGGEHGDIALLPTAGAQVAEALASSHGSAVLDISRFSKAGRIQFATDFAETFFEAKKRSPGPVCLVLEEAQRYIPQVVRFADSGLPRCLGAYEEIAEQGRNYGVGLLLISLRPEKLNKDVLNLSENVFALRMLGVHERKAVAEWVQEHEVEGREDVKNELPSLPRGQAIFWSPVTFGIYGKFDVVLKSTYDAGKTPHRALASVAIEPLDLGKLEASMTKVVEEAKANDPRALRAEIARLNRELVHNTVFKPAAPGPVVEKRVDVPVVPPVWVDEVKRVNADLVHRTDRLTKLIDAQVGEFCAELSKLVHLGVELAPPATMRKPQVPRPMLAHPVLHKNSVSRTGVHDPNEVGVGNSGLRRMLIALAQRPRGLTNGQLGVRAGVSSKSGTFSTYLSRARAHGWIGDDGPLRRITDAGLEALGDFDPLPEGRALADHWTSELGGGAARMLRVLVEAYPEALSKVELGRRAAISPSSGTFSTYLSRLRSLELVEGRGEVRASQELFEVVREGGSS